MLGQWRAGKVRLLGVSTKRGVGIVAGCADHRRGRLPGFENVTWYGLIATQGARPEDRRAHQRGGAQGAGECRPCARSWSSLGTRRRAARRVEQFRATVKADRAKWAEIVKTSGAKID